MTRRDALCELRKRLQTRIDAALADGDEDAAFELECRREIVTQLIGNDCARENRRQEEQRRTALLYYPGERPNSI
jgi:hypothetical protein